MNFAQKTILSLIISIAFFAAFSLIAFGGLFDFVETRFYSPQIVTSLDREVEKFAQTIDTLLGDLRSRFADTLENGAVQRSFLPDQETEDIFERSRLYGLLMNSLPGLRSVRFVDAGGSRIHFSTLPGDVLIQTGSSLSYRSYRDCPGVLPYRDVETEAGQPSRIIFDGSGEQLIFSYPFSDSLDTYRGSALFSFSARAVAEHLIRRGQIKAGEDVVLVDSPDGFLLGLPATETGNLKREAAAAWREDILTLFIPDYPEVEPLALISAKSETGFFVGRLVQERLLVLPFAMRFILLASFFLTTFLVILLIFNLRQDSITVVRSRLKQLQISLMRQYYDTKDDLDWKLWSRELKRRREDVRNEIKRGLPPGNDKGVDLLIDRAWDRLTAFAGPPAEFDEEKIRALVMKILRETALLERNTPENPDPGLPAAFQEELEELAPAEDSAGEPAAEDPAIEKSGAEDTVPPDTTPVTPRVVENGGGTAAEQPPPESPEDLAAIISQIEFGSTPFADIDVLSMPDNTEVSKEDDGVLKLDLSSPFDTFTFDSPGFDGAERETGAPKKRQTGAAEENNAGGLEEISGEGGLPLIYRPFQFQGNSKPIPLRPLPEPAEELIHERDGLHLINSDILDPTLETTRELDPKFLRLVESIIGHEHSLSRGKLTS
ncbi:MAG: hypothetical protein LBP20_02705 [Treponema sp.]|jgi:hypothetical protein|nr:hypothetical protein [Treponema sp.]